jgi:hypothetical protein
MTKVQVTIGTIWQDCGNKRSTRSQELTRRLASSRFQR